MIVTAEKWSRIPEVPIHEAIFFGVDNYLNAVALVDGENPRTSYTYRQLISAVNSVASGLKKRGFVKGDVIAFFSHNSTQFAIGVMACCSIGATFTGVNINYKIYELGHQLSDSRAKGIVTTSKHIPIIKSTIADKTRPLNLQKIITVDERVPGCDYFGDLLTDDGSAYPHGLSFNVMEDVAAIMYSSGTTGLPKGVMLTHHNIVANMIQMMDPVFMSPLAPGNQRAALDFLPMFHVFGISILFGMLSIGAKVVTLSGFVPDTFLEAIQNFRITELYVVPPIVVFLAKSPLVAKYDVSSLKKIASGAAPLTEDVEKEFLQRFKVDSIYQCYGMTELTSAVIIVPYGKPRSGSSGKLCTNTQAKVVDVTTGKMLSFGEEGEILIKGPQVMKGYLNRPDATRDTIDSEGWLHSGDIGYFDVDGHFFITGRIKELIKHKGFQVAPAEVEGLVMTHPGVADAAVIGVPDHSAGELPRAFVVKKPNATVTEKDITDFVKERLSRHKWLSGGVQFVEAIPKTASGKIMRRDVKKLLTNSKL